MKTTILRLLSALLVLGMSFVDVISPVQADAPADVLDVYSIAIAPQADGSLVMNYSLQNYCTNSDWPSDQPYLQVGTPNGYFEIKDWGPKAGVNKVINAEPVNSGGTFVQLDFDPGNLPKNGDCFNLNFTIVQNKIAYPDPQNENITFKFIPAGWKFSIQVKTLNISWALPDQTKLKLADPKPMDQGNGQMIWTWANPAMDASSMFHDSTLKFAYDKSAFTLSEATTSKNEGGGDVPFWGSPLCWGIFWTIVIILLILFVIAVSTEAYNSGDGIGPAIITVTDNIGEALSDISDAGGAGGSSGHSSSCACAGCACACACAGGGKVGCSRKAIGISCLKKVVSALYPVKPGLEK